MANKKIFTRSDIRNCCYNAGYFERGQILANRDCVNDIKLEILDIHDCLGHIKITAKVKGNIQDSYEASVTIMFSNPNERIVICNLYGSKCQCLTSSGWNFCKHAAALAIKASEEITPEELIFFINSGNISMTLEELRSFMSGGNKKRSSKTSGSLMNVMDKISLKNRNRFFQENPGGDIDFELHLGLETEAELLTLKIGNKKKFVVKDVRQTIEAIRAQHKIAYGKNLEFVHSQNAFSKEALPVVSFLLNLTNANLPLPYDRAADKRYIRLTPEQLESFLAICENHKFKVTSTLDSYILDSEFEIDGKIEKCNPVLPVKIYPAFPAKYKASEKLAAAMEVRKDLTVEFPKIFLLEGTRQNYILYRDVIYKITGEYFEEMKEVLYLITQNSTKEKRNSNYHSGHSKNQYILNLDEPDFAEFSSILLPTLQKYCDVHLARGIDFSKYEAEEPLFKTYLDVVSDEDGECLSCTQKVSYGEGENEKQHNLADNEESHEYYRDAKSEFELRSILQSYFPEVKENLHNEKQFFLPYADDEEKLADFIQHGIPAIEQYSEIFATDAFKKIRVTSRKAVTTGLSIKGNLLDVSWDVDGMSRDELYSILSAYRRNKKYFKLKSGELLNISESGIETLAQMQDDLNLTKSQIQSGQAELPVFRALYLDALMKENSERLEVRLDNTFTSFMAHVDEVFAKTYTVPREINADLRNYQKEGFAWASSLAELGLGGILADDMGLGKTLQMITLLHLLKNNSAEVKTNLIVCPASLLYNWGSEFQKFAPDMKIGLLAGTAAERKAILDDYKNYDALVTSYSLLIRDIENYQSKTFDIEIIDEAQYIKNQATLASKAVKSVDSRVRFALTGTPIENRLSELWSIFEYLMPGYLFSYKHFKDTFETSIMDSVENPDSNQKTLSRLHKMISPFILRRLKGEVLKDLPEKVEEVIYTKFETEQEKLYKATEKNVVETISKKTAEDFNESKLTILAELTKLREICCDPALLFQNYKGGSAKLETCLELISNAVEGGHKILLFSQFTSMLSVIENRLKEQKDGPAIRYLKLTGETSKIKRRDLVEKFQNGEADVFLISLKAGGTGLNLTAADMVIHYDPWWNVAAQNQATDRSHRIGQKNNVTVFKLIAKDTIEERILKLQEKKKDLADKIISAEGISAATLSKDDLLELISGTRE